MLLVKTEIKQSTIPNIGLGLFAAEFIPKNTIIWAFNHIVDKIIPQNKLIYLEQIERDYLTKYAYRVGTDLILCSDNGKYINHSTNPNVDDFIDIHNRSLTVANRDIQAGEELFSDYSSFDDDSKDGLKNYV